jgi:hypothetical protein
MAFKVTWRGHERSEGGTYTFEPGESKYFKSREHVPAELMLDHRFHAEAVPYEEAFPPEVVVAEESLTLRVVEVDDEDDEEDD